MCDTQRADKAYWLKLQRKRCGLTQKELARLSGISLRAVQSYEQGTRSLSGASIELVQALCRVLGCSEADILSYPGGRASVFDACTDAELCQLYGQQDTAGHILKEKDYVLYQHLSVTEQNRQLTEEMARRLYRSYTEQIQGDR